MHGIHYMVQTSTPYIFAVCAKVKSFWCLTLFDNANKIPFVFEQQRYTEYITIANFPLQKKGEWTQLIKMYNLSKYV